MVTGGDSSFVPIPRMRYNHGVLRAFEEIMSRNPMGEGGGMDETVGEHDSEQLADVDVSTLDGDFVMRLEDSNGTQVVLAPMAEAHAAGYYREINENRRMLEVWLPSFRTAYRSLEETQDIMKQELDWTHRAKCLRWTILVDGMVKGNVGLNVIDWKGKVGYLGYWLSSDAQGRGIVSKAVKEICRFGFEVLNLDHMDISARKKNEKSAAVASRLGFRKQVDIEDNEPGVKFPLDVYILTRKDGKFDRIAEDAREEYFLLNARGYLGRPDPVSFSVICISLLAVIR